MAGMHQQPDRYANVWPHGMKKIPAGAIVRASLVRVSFDGSGDNQSVMLRCVPRANSTASRHIQGSTRSSTRRTAHTETHRLYSNGIGLKVNRTAVGQHPPFFQRSSSPVTMVIPAPLERTSLDYTFNLRSAPGGMPTTRLNARLNAGSE